MAHGTITARIDLEDKKAFDSFCSNMGINASVAINMFVKAVLRQNRIPFEIKIEQTSDPFYSTANMSHLKKSVQDLRNGKGSAHELIETDGD